MRRLTNVKLKVGVSYLFGDWKHECVFIKTTPKGYNFLDIKTFNCKLKRSLFVNNKRNVDSNGYYTFLIPETLKIWEIKRKGKWN